ncbi:MAG TPA: hypothetical protein VFH46_01755 [Pyrinomonadaceae bacterium]|nr:hypothetical protein [Pyrinomonadaceae bacterium]
MTFSIILSLVLILGGAEGPTGSFDESTATSDSVVTTSQTTTTTTDTVQRSKKN